MTSRKSIKQEPEDGEQDTTIASSPSQFISCHELKARIDGGQNEMLLIDCRPAEEYANSSIITKNAINIPNDQIGIG